MAEIPCADQTEESGIFSLLNTLSPADKNIILLHDLEGYALKEVAAMLGIGLSAAKMRLSRARERLKKQMEREGEYV